MVQCPFDLSDTGLSSFSSRAVACPKPLQFEVCCATTVQVEGQELSLLLGVLQVLLSFGCRVLSIGAVVRAVCLI